MDQELLEVLRHGDEYKIKQLALRQDIFSTSSPGGNAVLHMAVRFRNQQVIREILRQQDFIALRLHYSLLRQKNLMDETALHIAARIGDRAIVSEIMKYLPAVNQVGPAPVLESLFRMTDIEGNTPLHNAVTNQHKRVIRILVEKDSVPSSYINKAYQTPLSIAIDARLNDIACFIIDKSPESLNTTRLPDELTLIHFVVMRQNYDIMVKILGTNKELIDRLDWHQRNPLHYAAASGNVKMAQRLLEESKRLAYKRDCNGETPLHLAAENGKLKVLKLLINKYPDAIEIRNNSDRSILHVAAKHGNWNIVSFILRSPEMENLINLVDRNGNTPLHLAAMGLHSDVVFTLSRHKSVNIRAKNHSARSNTALEIAEITRANGKEIQKHLTLKALKTAYAKRALSAEELQQKRQVSKEEGEKGKEMAQTLSVMATLIATFTFTAAFTIPGGVKSDGPDEGTATLLHRASFQAFVITDTIAMTSAMAAAAIIFWSFWRSKTESLMDTLPLAIGFTWIALVSMTLAFVTGLYAVLSNSLAITIAVCVIGCLLPFIFYVSAPFFMIVFDQTEVNPFALVVRFVRDAL
ncbi:ANK REP REGION domain-containing protein [Citrus sinensis]|uniref:PGG domain-containing protein n=2 Tax=Citrus TaxID=2706 RepID=A0A067F9D3_CITSI|nr:protein ACCELERATED CELL DEATH 6 [Citrus sinensis]XP_006475072.1 protein ACCELERATED CELL DEATH 6 [Citrus sinensis]XP_024048157.1 protein ACCELERATED CELL DEATH 6 isoform X1 [Citrus x clementina]XP_024048158.1 protein ACCELERATED CELL DEATH 6 isoform X1 [Citrus x clementina]XP_024048159.1 protein ACCELERATED CELL DEATH 6 isoform X1 [Citrus x clementina]XP_024048160.1 protein ACCELERATED CELL DEATH 6 isoform X1 [Citrus x clementina]XP_024953455.1 protein ACCELERATED CELL DEATH 6 [Citrus sin